MWFHLTDGSSGARVLPGPVSWVWGSNDHRNRRGYRCSNGRCNSLLQLHLALSRPNLGMVHEPLASICTSTDLLRITPGADLSSTELPQV